jgi:tetratricopeptide (TPR) repeat protein
MSRQQAADHLIDEVNTFLESESIETLKRRADEPGDSQLHFCALYAMHLIRNSTSALVSRKKNVSQIISYGLKSKDDSLMYYLVMHLPLSFRDKKRIVSHYLYALRKVEEKRDKRSPNDLGEYFFYILSVLVDLPDNKAKYSWRGIVEQDCPRCLYQVCYKFSSPVDQALFLNESFRYALKYSQCHQHPHAMRILARHYETGIGVEKDMEKAIYWYEKALPRFRSFMQQSRSDYYREEEASIIFTQISVKLGKYFYEQGNFEKSFTIFKDIQGLLDHFTYEDEPMTQLAVMFIKGLGTSSLSLEDRIRDGLKILRDIDSFGVSRSFCQHFYNVYKDCIDYLINMFQTTSIPLGVKDLFGTSVYALAWNIEMNLDIRVLSHTIVSRYQDAVQYYVFLHKSNLYENAAIRAAICLQHLYIHLKNKGEPETNVQKVFDEMHRYFNVALEQNETGVYEELGFSYIKGLSCGFSLDLKKSFTTLREGYFKQPLRKWNLIQTFHEHFFYNFLVSCHTNEADFAFSKMIFEFLQDIVQNDENELQMINSSERVYFMLGKCFQKGIGTAINLPNAFHYFMKAGRNGNDIGFEMAELIKQEVQKDHLFTIQHIIDRYAEHMSNADYLEACQSLKKSFEMLKSIEEIEV